MRIKPLNKFSFAIFTFLLVILLTFKVISADSKTVGIVNGQNDTTDHAVSATTWTETVNTNIVDIIEVNASNNWFSTTLINLRVHGARNISHGHSVSTKYQDVKYFFFNSLSYHQTINGDQFVLFSQN